MRVYTRIVWKGHFELQHEDDITCHNILVLQLYMLWKIPMKILVLWPLSCCLTIICANRCQCVVKMEKNRILTIATKIYKLRFELINYLPYSLDLISNNFFLFPRFKVRVRFSEDTDFYQNTDIDWHKWLSNNNWASKMATIILQNIYYSTRMDFDE